MLRVSLIVLLSLMSAAVLAENKPTPISPLRLNSVEKQMHTLNKNLKKNNKRLANSQQALEETEKEISKIKQSYRQSRKLRTHLQKQLRELNAEERRLNKALKENQEKLKAQIKTLYMIGPQPYLKVLLNQDNPTQTSKILTYYEYLHQAHINTIKKIKTDLHALEINRHRAQKDSQQLKVIQKKLQKKQVALKKQKVERQQVIANIDTELSNTETRYQELVHEEKQLHGIVNKLQTKKAASSQSKRQTQHKTSAQKTKPHKSAQSAKQAVKKTTTSYKAKTKPKQKTLSKITSTIISHKGKMPWPTEGRIVKHFADVMENHLRWNGVLIKAPDGQAVYAPASGEVIYSGWLRGFGFLIILNHGDGYLTLYGRNETLLRDVGDKVKPGDMLATVGQSGGFKKSGLYFEMRHNGKPVDPEAWYRRKTRR